MPNKDTELIIAGRQLGKTTRCIELAAENLAHIVCPNRKDVRRIDRKAKEMGKDIPFPLTADEFFRGQLYGRGNTAFVVDDIDRILRMYAGMVPIIGMSLTGESERCKQMREAIEAAVPLLQEDQWGDDPNDSVRHEAMIDLETAILTEENMVR